MLSGHLPGKVREGMPELPGSAFFVAYCTPWLRLWLLILKFQPNRRTAGKKEGNRQEKTAEGSERGYFFMRGGVGKGT
ncbi:MAG: hypothetical protein D3914_09735 [Candidatus Electrothrix sp. LOE2]|nr:hypothetical protein [Candidatus Electrothrix sp. LOE2]